MSMMWPLASAALGLLPSLSSAVLGGLLLPTGRHCNAPIVRSRPPTLRDTPSAVDAMRTLDVLATRGLDTLEDAILLARRVGSSPVDSVDCLAQWEDESDTRPRLLVVGSGWAAHALVKIVDADAYRLLVVSPRNYFIFTPMLAASSVGTVEYRSITEPMRASNPRAAFIEGSVTAIDPIARTASVRIGGATDDGDDAAPVGSIGETVEEEAAGAAERAAAADGRAGSLPVSASLQYDVCVYAAGVRASASRVPGVREHCLFLKGIRDAQRLRRAVGSALERASQPGLTQSERRRLLTLVVVGGGATGVEYAGELSDFLLDALSRLYPQLAEYARVVLVHGGPDLLPQFDEPLRAKAFNALSAKTDVEVKLRTRVERVDSPSDSTRSLVVRSDGEESTIECGLVVWAAGTGPVPLTRMLIERLDNCSGRSDADRPEWARDRILVDGWMRADGAPPGSLLALGDAAISLDFDGEPLPQTAQVAAQQGAYVARMLNRGYDLSGGSDYPVTGGEGCAVIDPPVSREAADGDLSKVLSLRGAVEARPFEFLNLGLLAYLGGGEALSQVQVGENRLLSEAGSTGFLLWRSVYVVKQVSPRTRFLVLFDWLKTKFFGRDVTRW